MKTPKTHIELFAALPKNDALLVASSLNNSPFLSGFGFCFRASPTEHNDRQNLTEEAKSTLAE